MKTLKPSLLALLLLAAGGTHAAVVFTENFSTSTLDSGSPAAPTGTSAAYHLFSSKSRSPAPTIGANDLMFGIGATSSGHIEAQALFATTPVALNSVNDYVELTVVFTNTTGLFAQGGHVGFGLYNSGGVAPLAGGLNGTATSSTTTNGGAQGWQGYVTRVAYNGGSHRIATRPAQTITTGNNQDLIVEGSGSQSYASGVNLATAASTFTNAIGALLTENLRVTLTAANTLQIVSKLYAGGDTNGMLLTNLTATATGTNYFTNKFDALAIGWRDTGNTAATRMDIRSITVNSSSGSIPVTVTLPATGQSNTVATLNGTVNPGGAATTAWFEWGLSPFTNSSTTASGSVGGGTSSVAVSNLLTGLTPGLIYHCRMVASNALGVVRGNDVRFGSPALVLNGAATMTNECHAAFADPGATATGAPLAVAGGTYHSLALKSDGTVAAWGYNYFGQTNIPIGLSNVVAIAGGANHSLALKSDGMVAAWGYNFNGQTNIPVGLSNVVAIAGGSSHNLALKSDGTVVAWGNNGDGETNIPVGLSNVVAIAGGGFHNLALKSDGTVVAWGYNNNGQTTIPVGLSNVVAIAGGDYHSLALKSDGTVAAWGDNPFGETTIPVGLSNVVAIAGGFQHSLAVKSDGTVAAWGRNFEGQTTIPVGLTNLTVVVSGTFNTNNSPGSYTLTYTASNLLGGVAMPVSRTVVVQDTLAPVITILGNNPLTIPLNVPFVDPGATALDACGGSFAISTNSTVNGTVVGTYSVTYSSTDGNGNSATNTRTVVVREPATLIVTTNSDDGNAGSLRMVVANAINGDTITFTNPLSGSTILLTSGPIVLDKNLTIDGSALANAIQLNGNHTNRIFTVNSGTTNVLNSVTITNGHVSGDKGGGIYNSGMLTLNSCALAGNSASADLSFNGGDGGGIFNNGTLALTNCVVAGNSAYYYGGGIYNTNGTLTVSQNTITSNSSGLEGGGLCNRGGTLTVNQSTLAGNLGRDGGGISSFNGSTLAVSQSTLTGNSGRYAGGIMNFNASTVTVNHSTLVGNSASGGFPGGGIYSDAGLNLTNTIVCSNTAPVSVYANIFYGINYSVANNLVDANALLAPLGNYGGPTPTMPPLPGSPAINAGLNSAASGFTYDQRGTNFARIVGGTVDIGAVETGTAIPGFSPVVTVNSDTVDGDLVNGVSLREAVAFATNGATITFTNTLSGQTILLTNGPIVLDKNLTIDGSGLTNGIQLNGNHASRIFTVNSGTTNVLTALTITNGFDIGGGILNQGMLTVNICALVNNSSGGGGGGGIYNNNTLKVNNCTFANNSSGAGGGIYNGGMLTVNNCTLVNNSGILGGGGINNNGTLNLTNSIICSNTGPSYPNIFYGSYSGANNLVDANALLTPLGNYGGPTPTMPPLPGSPAIGAGSDSVTNFFTFDQRGAGFPRKSGAHVDIGAVEAVVTNLPTVAWWRFEAGPNNNNVSHSAAVGVFSADVPDASDNGNDLSAWSTGGGTGYAYRSDVPSPTILRGTVANQFAVQNTGGFPTMFTSSNAAIHTITPLAWTIEVAFQPENGGYRTLVGRDSRNAFSLDLNLSTLYLQIQPNNSLAIRYGDVGGRWHEAISAAGLVQGFTFPNSANGKWQTVVAVCDGTNLSLYYKNIENGQTDYTLVAQTNVTLTGSPDTRLSAGAGSGSGWTHGTWTVGRGLYAGGHTDRAFGFIDEVRISTAALAPDDFLFAPRQLVVVNNLDSGSGSLRQTVLDALPGDIITFTNTLSGQTILLTNGQIVLDKSLTIDGSGLANAIQLNGNNNSRIFTVNSGTTNVLNSLTITNGFSSASADGGGIYNQGTLTVNNSTLANNSGRDGGGIYNTNTLTVNNCTFANNTGNFRGGGILNLAGGSKLVVNNSTFTGNITGGGGGGLFNQSLMTVNNCALANNSGGNFGGGIYNDSGTLNLTNTIVCGNTASFNPNISGSITSGANNLVDANALLAPLGNYGGPTQTMPPLPGSPAINTGLNSAAGGFTYDQRGTNFARILGGTVDIGAVEIQAVPSNPLVVTTSNDEFNGVEDGVISLREAVAFATNGTAITFTNPLSGATILLTNGQIVLNKNLTIDGSALTNGIQLNGNHASRIFTVNSGTTNVLNSLTITNGFSAGGDGGGIYNSGGTLMVNACTLAGNTTPGYGGGVYVNSGAVTINNSTLANNSCSLYGGGIFIFATSDTLTINNSTLANNSSQVGGGIYHRGTLKLTNSIVCSNTASFGGANIDGVITSGANNLVNTNALLAPLGNYGGPTQTMPPLPGSPAINTGLNSAASGFTYDQRGTNFARIFGGTVDIGAVESQVCAASVTVNSATICAGSPVSLTATNTATNPVYLWSNGGTNQSITVSPTSTTNYTVSVFDTASGCIATATGTVTVSSTSIVVTNLADSGPGTLRQAVLDVCSGGTITFAPGLSGATILLTNGQIVLDKNLTIDGAGLANAIQLNGNHTNRIFEVAASTTVALDSLTLTNGFRTGAVYPTSDGGAILNYGDLTVNRCTFAGNSAHDAGAIMLPGGTLKLMNSTLAGNSAANNGGALSSAFAPMVALTNCTLAGNYAATDGGAIYVYSAVTTDQLALMHCTVSSNSAGSGSGGITFYQTAATLANTIIAGNGGTDVNNSAGTLVFAGSNIVPNVTGAASGSAPINLSPQLASLGNYGGPTPTMPPLPGSPAINAGSDTVTNFLASDQRGFARKRGAHVDIGAVETSVSLLVVLNNNDSGAGSLRQVVADADSDATITFTNTLSGQTILLTNGQIVLDKNLTIDGSALASPVQLNGNHTNRIFTVNSGTTNVLNSLVITNGYAASNGGGIRNLGNLVVNACTIAGNTVSNASGDVSGGGVANETGAIITLNNSTISGNVCAGDYGWYGGGLLVNQSTATVNQCTISGNSTTLGGGGIWVRGTLTVNQSTLSLNTVANTTFATNDWQGGGGICGYLGTVAVTNCLIANNSAVSGPNLKVSLATPYIGPNNLTNGMPQLAALGNYGGPTPTMPPLPGSPAIDAGAVTTLTTDQRGLPRVVGADVDIGAVELQTLSPNVNIVTTTTDELNGFEDGVISLREAVAYATNGATITFTNTLSGQTILLTNGPIVLDKNLTIDGSALANAIQLNGNHTNRIFAVNSGTTNVLNSLVITNGYDASFGGDIYNQGTLTVSNCTLAGGSTLYGGGICNTRTLTVDNCTFTGNTGSGGGGGMLNLAGATRLTVNNSTFAGNISGGSGGGLFNQSLMTVTHCTLANNSGSSAGGAGGGGIYNDNGNGGTTRLTNSIVCSNTISGSPNNMFGSYSGANNLVNANALLASLGNYGGPTQTMPPLPSSPAIDAGAATTLTTDQRGAARVFGPFADIGAVEGVFNPSFQTVNPVRLGNGSFQFGFTNLSGASYTVFASTNVALPFAQWSNLGAPVESPAGTFTFTDPQATNNVMRFYRVRSP